MNPLLSIIVPAYNISQYINRCIQSLNLIEYTTEVEIIIVNDGSSDNTLDVINQIAAQYTFIKIIDKPNCGPSSARNAGIKAANGLYIWFIDGDDVVSPKSIETIISYLHSNKDVYIIDHYNCYNGKAEYYSLNFEGTEMPGIEVLKINGAMQAWITISRRELLQTYHIYFTEGILHEDFEWNIRLFCLADKVEHINKALYYYYTDHPYSIMNTVSANSPIGYASCVLTISNFQNCNPQLTANQLEIIRKMVAVGITFSMLRCKNIRKEEFKKVLFFYKKNKTLIASYLRYSTKFHYILSFLMIISPKLCIKYYTFIKGHKIL